MAGLCWLNWQLDQSVNERANAYDLVDKHEFWEYSRAGIWYYYRDKGRFVGN